MGGRTCFREWFGGSEFAYFPNSSASGCNFETQRTLFHCISNPSTIKINTSMHEMNEFLNSVNCWTQKMKKKKRRRLQGGVEMETGACEREEGDECRCSRDRSRREQAEASRSTAVDLRSSSSSPSLVEHHHHHWQDQSSSPPLLEHNHHHHRHYRPSLPPSGLFCVLGLDLALATCLSMEEYIVWLWEKSLRWVVVVEPLDEMTLDLIQRLKGKEKRVIPFYLHTRTPLLWNFKFFWTCSRFLAQFFRFLKS